MTPDPDVQAALAWVAAHCPERVADHQRHLVIVPAALGFVLGVGLVLAVRP